MVQVNHNDNATRRKSGREKMEKPVSGSGHKKTGSLIPFTRTESGGGDPHDIRSPLYQQLVMRRFNREWAAHLTTPEYRVLGFILDQTVNWGRASRLFSYRFMEHGDRDNNPHGTVGIGITKRNLMYAVASLEQKGVIFVDRADMTKGLLIMPNTKWVPGKSGLCVSKRVKEQRLAVAHTEKWGDEIDTPPVSKTTLPPCQNRHPIKEEYSEDYSEEPPLPAVANATAPGWEERKEVTVNRRQRPTGNVTTLPLPAKKETTPPVPETPPSDDWDEPAAPAPETNGAARFLTERKPIERVLKPGAIEQTFRRAFEEAFGDRPGTLSVAWTGVERGMAKKGLIDRWMGTPEELHAFIDYSVRRWEMIVARDFAFMKRNPPPPLPTLRFLIGQFAGFLSAYRKRAREDWLNSIDDREARLFHELVTEGGRTEEEAKMVIAQERAETKLHKQMAETRKVAAEDVRMARRIRAEAQRPRYDHNNPHPDSQIGRERRHAALQAAIRSDPDYKPIGLDDPIPDLVAIANMPFREE